METKRKFFVILLLFWCLGGFIICAIDQNLDCNQKNSLNPTTPSRFSQVSPDLNSEFHCQNVTEIFNHPRSQTLHTFSPLMINSDENLLANASFYGWIGEGTVTNPIRIESAYFTSPNVSETLISFENTTLYVNIFNSQFQAGYLQMNLVNVFNLNISNCSFQSSHNGIAGKSTKNITIENSHFQNLEYYAISMQDSEKTQIENLTIKQCGLGIGIKGKNVEITENIFLQNEIAVELTSIEEGEVFDNLIANNTEGLKATGFNIELKIYHNTICYNSMYGIRYYDDHIEIYENNLIHNDLNDRESFQYGAFEPYSNNSFFRNFDSRIYGEDSDHNGIFDQWAFYDINTIGSTSPNFFDNYPVIKPYSLNHLQILTIPTIKTSNIASYAIEAYDVLDVGNFSLNWTHAHDTYGYSVSYELLYSTCPQSAFNGANRYRAYNYESSFEFVDNQTKLNWTRLASDLASNWFEWDDPTPENNSFYFFKVIARSEGGLIRSDISYPILLTLPAPPPPPHIRNDLVLWHYLLPLNIVFFISVFIVFMKRKKKKTQPQGLAMLD